MWKPVLFTLLRPVLPINYELDLRYRHSRVRFYSTPDAFVGYEFAFTDDETGDEHTGVRAMAPDAPTDLQAEEHEVPLGDYVVEMTTFYKNELQGRVVVAIELRTKEDRRISSGPHDGAGIYRGTQKVPDGKDLRGLKLRVRHDIVSDVALVVRGIREPLARDHNDRTGRHLDRIQLLKLDARVAKIKEMAETSSLEPANSFAALLKTGQAMVNGFNERGMPTVAPFTEGLLKACKKGKKQIQPRGRRLWMRRVDRESKLESVRDSVQKLINAMASLSSIELASLLACTHLDEADLLRLRSFVSPPITAANKDGIMALCEAFPIPMTNCNAARRLFEFLISTGDVDGLDKLHLGAGVVDELQRMPAIRIAIASKRPQSFHWLIDTAKLDPINPTDGEVSVELTKRLGLQATDFSRPPMEIITCKPGEDDHAAQAILKTLKCLDNRCVFVREAISLLSNGGPEVTGERLVELVPRITLVQDLLPLDKLAKSLSLQVRSDLFKLAAKHITKDQLFKDNHDMSLFTKMLTRAHAEGLVSEHECEELRREASLADVRNAPVVRELSERVDRLEATVTALRLDVTSLRKDVVSLRNLAIATHRQGVDSQRQQRIVTLLSSVLVLFAPVGRVLVDCLDISEPLHVLNAIATVGAESVKSFVSDASVGCELKPEVVACLTQLDISPDDVALGLRLQVVCQRASARGQVHAPGQAIGRLQHAVHTIVERTKEVRAPSHRVASSRASFPPMRHA